MKPDSKDAQILQHIVRYCQEVAQGKNQNRLDWDWRPMHHVDDEYITDFLFR